MRAVAAKIEPLLCKQFFWPLLSRLFYQSPAAAVAAEVATPEELLASHPYISDSRTNFESELRLAEDVLSVLSTQHDIELPLELLVPIFSPHLVVTVLENSPPNTVAAFRFFNWASRRAEFWSPTAYRLVVSRMREDPTGLESSWECLSLLREAGVPMSAYAFEALIGAYALSGMPVKVLECYDRMVEYRIPPTTFVYNTVMSTLVKNDVFLIVSAVYSQMVKADCRSNKSTFSILIDAYRREGEPDKALHMLDEMSKSGFAPTATVFNNTIYSMCKAGRIKEAMELFNRMRTWKRLGFVLDSFVYTTILDAYCKSGKIDKAFHILEEFKREGYVPGLHGYTSLIDAMLSLGRYMEAIELFKEMLHCGIEPDCVVFTVFIKHYAQEHDMEKALKLLDEMVCRGIKPDTFCYNTLIKGLCDIGCLDEAKSLVSQISNNEFSPNTQTYNIYISALCRQGLIQNAQNIFEEMENQGCFPSRVTFNTLINGLCKSGKVERAKIMFHKMEVGRHQSLFLRLSQPPNRLVNADHLPELQKKWCDSGQTAKAYSVLQELEACGIVKPDATTITSLIDYYCKTGDLDRACKLYEELPRMGLSPDDVTYSVLINAFLRKREFLKAERFFDDMRRTGCKARLSVLCVIMRAWCKIGHVSAAVRFWFDYLPIMEDELSSEGSEHISTAKKQFDMGLVGDAVGYLMKIDIKNASCYSPVYCIWLSGYCMAGKLREALQIWTVLKKYNIEVTSDCCRSLIAKFSMEGGLDVAVDGMNYIIEKGYEIEPFHADTLFQKLCYCGKQGVANQLASDMKKAGYDLRKCLSSRIRNRLGSMAALTEQPEMPP